MSSPVTMPGSVLSDVQSPHPAGPGNSLARQEHSLSSKSPCPAEAALSKLTKERKEKESLRRSGLSPV